MDHTTLLNEMAKHISNTTLKFDRKKDGRLESNEIEDAVIKELSAAFPNQVEKAKIRCWHDFLVLEQPCQFKASNLGTDNFSSWAALAWVFTDLPLERIKKVNFGNIVQVLTTNLDLNSDRDYPIFVFNKSTGEARVFYLTQLVHLTANGNNPPFQVNWKKEWYEPSQTKSTKQEAYERILQGVCHESMDKRAEASLNFNDALRRLPRFNAEYP